MNRKNLFICILLVGLLPGSLVQAQLNDSSMQVADGFKVEQIYAVPGETQGSWVALCVDDRGRLIAGDQNGGLFRITLDESGAKSVEPLDLEVGFVNGLVCAFDSLYAVVAEDEYQGGGLYRIRDTDGDDRYDDVQFLRGFVAKGEHGPHSVIVGPEGKWLYVIAGNKTPIPEGEGLEFQVPPHWGEDDLLPRLWGPIGSEKGTTAPGGWIARTDPEGKTWAIVAIGFRNAFDLAFNQEGDLFTVDADAEFDMSTAWYQPTRLLHVVAGTDYGWRSGSGKWPPYFSDTVPPVYEYGPGSPTGITFGYGTNFPEKYRQAFFACDWSWGRVFVSWLKPNGASYTVETEEFLSGIPLPIADLVVNPFDGVMYFVLGGRGTTSGLYRITYTGSEKEAAFTDSFGDSSVLKERRSLEKLINTPPVEAVSIAWPYLSSEDRVLRHSARIILEHAPVTTWKNHALSETNTKARMTALLGLARTGGSELLPNILASLIELDWARFDPEEKLFALRCLEVTFIRMDSAGTSQANDEIKRIRQKLESLFPAGDIKLDSQLVKLLVYLQSEKATLPALTLLESAVTQEDKLRFILPLRLQTLGWTPALRERYFKTLGRAHGWTGGLSLTKYLEMIIADSLKTVPKTERDFFSKVIEDSRPQIATLQTENRPFVKLWTLEDLLPVSTSELKGRDIANGRKSFTAAGCFACHRVNGEGGGIGPDLSSALRRFSVHDFLEAVIEPSKVISDQFGMSEITKTDGTTIHGRVVNYYGDSIGIQTDSLNAAEILRVPRKDIVSLEQSPVSPMPPGLLSKLTREDILDVVAFLSSGY